MGFYAEIYKKRFDEYPRINFSPLFMVLLKRAFIKYGEIKVAAAILVHFEQNSEKIIAEKFPFHWVFANIDKYLLYLQEKNGVDIDNEKELMSCIKNRLKYLAINFHCDTM